MKHVRINNHCMTGSKHLLHVVDESTAADDYKYIAKLLKWSFNYYMTIWLLILYKPGMKWALLYYFFSAFQFVRESSDFWSACW